MKWQIIVNTITVLVYLGLSVVLLHFWGLTGFCVGTLITNVLRVIFVVLIYYRSSSIDETHNAKC